MASQAESPANFATSNDVDFFRPDKLADNNAAAELEVGALLGAESTTTTRRPTVAATKSITTAAAAAAVELRSPRVGFQELLQRLQNAKVFEEFMAQKREGDLFDVVYDCVAAREFRPRMGRKGKDLDVATKLEKRGYSSFLQKKYTEAMRYYNQAALVAPKSESLGLIYCHRSAVSFLWCDYGNCLDDINRALSFNLPTSARKRLEFRRAKCEILLRSVKSDKLTTCNNKAASDASDDPEDSTDADTESSTKDTTMANNKALSSSTTALTTKGRASGTKNDDKNDNKRPKRLHQHLSQALPPKIVGGEVLSVEEPYAKVCVPNYWKTHCQHCLRPCDIVIPCPSCSLVCFCSEKCQDSATVYHSIECTHILDLRLLGENSGVLLAYRVFTQDHVDFFRRWAPVIAQIESFREHNVIFGHKTKVRNFPAVYATLTHVWDKNPVVSFRAAAAAVYLVKSLDQASYFASSLTKEADKRFIGRLLFHCVLSVSSNFFSLPENVPLKSVGDITNVAEVGSAFFPNAAFFNHSCFPEAMHYFVDNQLVCRALLPAKPGDQCRLSWLGANYYFACDCQACREDWPQFADLSDERKPKCLVCSEKHEDLDDHHDHVMDANNIIATGTGIGTTTTTTMQMALASRMARLDALERKFLRLKVKVDKGSRPKLLHKSLPLCLAYLAALHELFECPNRSFLNVYDFVGDLFQLEPYSSITRFS
ncbi:unnamed protein product [Notodromas monacha]|uniref:SET and MYND domain-containing protein 4 n=1 Tax=Notodromas monacha TaxID=399045 RepID=A0A7R9BZ19_9CRUS|nr:unnamed protein product [Notodromas monacha]CAG0923312.1 unnamed protein product [Notodromas monacha]